MGFEAREMRLPGPGRVHVTANLAALLDTAPDEKIHARRYDQQPYWELERARIGNTRRIPVEVIVNGESVAKQEVEADGALRPVSFDVAIDRSSWIALRVLPSSHTNPIFVVVGGKP